MGTLLSKVEAVFSISGRGCVIAPGIPKGGASRVKMGDALVLKRPDGRELRTHVRGIEMGGAPQSLGIPILVGADLVKDDIPIGTEVWTTE
jgi:hypothetical protein